MIAIRHTVRLITCMLAMIALLITLAPAGTQAQGTYDGNWSGTTAEGRPFSFTVVTNGIKTYEYRITFSGSGFCPSVAGAKAEMSPPHPIEGNTFSIEGYQITLNGTFNSDTSASGTLEVTINDGQCRGSANTTWTATKEGAAQPEPQPQPDTEERCFSETGYCISGRIREYWEQNGGLPVFGLPIGPQQEETIEGQPIQAQWFERNRLELHPANARPYDVLLGRLGVDRLIQQGRDWFTFAKGQPQDGCLFFDESGHSICEPFLSAWRASGLELDGAAGKTQAENLALFGLPISEPQTETMSDGKEYTVQWFERARFESHPENQPPFNVLLGLLGSEVRNPPANQEPEPEPEQPIGTINTSVGVLHITGYDISNRFPPNCDTSSPPCSFAKDGFQVLIVWLDRADGGSIVDLGSTIFDASEGAYVIGSDGSRSDRFTGGIMQGRGFVGFSPLVNTQPYQFIWPGNEPVILGQ